MLNNVLPFTTKYHTMAELKSTKRALSLKHSIRKPSTLDRGHDKCYLISVHVITHWCSDETLHQIELLVARRIQVLKPFGLAHPHEAPVTPGSSTMTLLFSFHTTNTHERVVTLFEKKVASELVKRFPCIRGSCIIRM